MPDASKSNRISTRLLRIAELARQTPRMTFTSLNHHLDIDWLKEAFERTRKDGAPGIDGQTADDYARDLEANLRSLLDRVKTGTYRAPAVRRVHLPKGDGNTRPIGIPTLEDKVLQRAVVMLLEPIFEQDFLPCSYGFRPGRSAHQALQAFWQQAMAMGGGFVLEVDLRRFFDTVDPVFLMELLRRRVSDGVVLRLIRKWLHAGVMEEGSVWYPERGTPQGGVISPLLANLYLHEVIDVWMERDVKPRLHGQAHVYRYADDVVILFASEEDARRVHQVLPRRLAKAGLELHPDKTRRVDFRHPQDPAYRRKDSERKGPASFSLLGFTHFWGRSRKGAWVVQRKTAKDRFARVVRVLQGWCQRYRHLPVRVQHRSLCAKIRGHYAYFGITGNYRWIRRLWYLIGRLWKRWLDRRNSRPMTWERFARLLQHYPLPRPHIAHSSVPRSANP